MDVSMESLSKQVADLQGLLSTLSKKNGAVDGVVGADVIHKDEMEKMKVDILDIMEKRMAESRKPKDNGDDDKPKPVSLNKFLCKVKRNDPSLTKTAHSEGTDAVGGYTVPSGLDSMIFGEIYNAATVVSKCTPYPHGPMDGSTKKINSWLTGVTITNSAEAAVKVVTNATWAQKNSVLKKMTAIGVFTDELLQDNISSLDQKFAEKVGQAMAVEQERQILVGDVTGSSDPFDGVGYLSGVNSVAQKAAGLSYSDFVRLLNYEMLEQYHTGAEMYMRRSVYQLAMGLVDANNRPLFNIQTINDRMRPVILGVPVNISSQIPKTLGTGSNQSLILYGNWGNVLLGYKEGGVGSGIQVDVATQAIISTTTNVTLNLWTQDETGFRFVKRHSIVIPVADSFVKMTGVK